MNEIRAFYMLSADSPSHCTICDRVDDASDANVGLYPGNMHYRCYRADTKGSMFVWSVGKAEPYRTPMG